MEPWPRNPAVTEHAAEVGAPAATFYLASGPEDGPLVVFVHGWPELSISWRHQLPCLGALGFRAVAPDMRGYGRSYIPSTHEEVAHEHTWHRGPDRPARRPARPGQPGRLRRARLGLADRLVPRRPLP